MRTITVKGIGAVSVKPDLIVLRLSMETAEYEYDAAMKAAAEKIDFLNKALEAAGFEKKSAKTADFRVRADYDRLNDGKGNYTSVFMGYKCRHELKIEFDFDTKRLAKALSEISKCIAKPEISIDFTVKDSSAVSGELLKAAVKNAREKAEILCAASGAKLGELLSIDYNWGELHLYSATDYDVEGKCMMSGAADDMDIEPEEIKARDTATFAWEIA
ncbi:MAG: SIMPL domain-containing protein [Christensenellaceae bacterium]